MSFKNWMKRSRLYQINKIRADDSSRCIKIKDVAFAAYNAGWNHCERNKEKSSCEWKENKDGAWDTNCKECFEFIDGGPMNNNMQWCCYCGKRLIEVPFPDTTFSFY